MAKPRYKPKTRHKIGKKGTRIRFRALEDPPYHVGQVVPVEVTIYPNRPHRDRLTIVQVGTGPMDGRVMVKVWGRQQWASLGDPAFPKALDFTIEGGQEVPGPQASLRRVTEEDSGEEPTDN